MNPVFLVLVDLKAVALWFLLAFIFFPLGKFLWRIGSDVMEELKKDDKKDDKKDKQEDK